MALEDITPEEFVDTRFSHNSSKEFFDSIEVHRRNYQPVHLSVTSTETLSEDFSYHAELSLAKEQLVRVVNL